ncbi:MAG: citrate synthase [Pseudomonadota bacterium]
MADSDTTPPNNRTFLSAAEVAERLGVKVETVYAYVSRGRLTRHQRPGQRHSEFNALEVEALRNRRANGGGASGGAGGGASVAGIGARNVRGATTPASTAPEPGFVLDSAITRIDRGQLFYRGRDACAMARERSFEQVAEWIWGCPSRAEWPGPITHAVPSLPGPASPGDRIRAAISYLAPLDPFRYDLRPNSVLHCAKQLIASLVAALPSVGPDPTTLAAPPGLAGDLWPRLSRRPPRPADIDGLNTALSLLADHEMATSTLAVRVAGSVRADLHSALAAGFSAVAGPLHGRAGAQAHQLLNDIDRVDVAVAKVGEFLRDHDSLPGFGHMLYPNGDPRAGTLFDALRQSTNDRVRARMHIAEHVISLTDAQRLPPPNIDFALAAFCDAHEMITGAPEAIFSIGRSVGWVAHLLEEYEAPPLRFRVRARYVGPIADNPA